MERPSKKRRPRFKRTSAPNIRLTDRDIEIVAFVGRHRFVRSRDLVSLVGGSEQQILRRLRLLYDNHFLDRPRIQVDRYRPGEGGSRPMVYALGNCGADLLTQVVGVPRASVDWTTKNREVKRRFLDHTLEITDFMVRLELSVRAQPNVELVTFEEILEEAPKKTRESSRPAGWAVRFIHNGRTHQGSVYPDGIFALRFTDAPPGANRAFFFLEIDRANMPVERSNLKQSSFYKKALGYYHSWELWKLNPKKAPYGFIHARVLTVTTTPERASNFREKSKKASGGKGTGLFLFTHRRAIRGSADLLSLSWLNGRGEARTLRD